MASLEFTLMVNSCLGCNICPQNKLGESYKGERKMTEDNFFAILDKVPTDVRIDFSGFNEPYLHPSGGFFMGMATQLGYTVHIYSTLIGLKPTQANVLRDVPPAYFRVHVPDQHHLHVLDDLWIKQHELFLTSGIKGSYMAMSHLTPKILEHLTSKGIEVELPSMISRAGLVKSFEPIHRTGLIRCAAERFHSNVVLPNGDVQICCMGWDLSMPCGNLLTMSYEEITKIANEYEANTNPPENSLCRRCEWSANL